MSYRIYRPEKPIEDYKVGDSICDMHYGTDQLEKQFKILSHAQWHEPQDWSGDFADYLAKLQRATRNVGYMNKDLIVIGVNPGWGSMETYTIVAAYAYDGRRNGIITLTTKE